MLLPIKFQADWALIRALKQQQTAKDNERENKNRVKHHYKVGDKILLRKPGHQPKLSAPREGPFDIIEVNETNGTVRIQKGPVSDRVNIRRIDPYFE